VIVGGLGVFRLIRVFPGDASLGGRGFGSGFALGEFQEELFAAEPTWMRRATRGYQSLPQPTRTYRPPTEHLPCTFRTASSIFFASDNVR